MAQNVANMWDILKDAWTETRIKKQFEDKNLPLGKLTALKGTQIGRQAQVPVQLSRSFGYTSTNAPGVLNAAGETKATVATYSLPASWFQISVDAHALVQATAAGAQSIIAAKDMEIESAVEGTNHQIVRQMATNGDGIIAACDTTSSSTTIKLIPAASEGAAYGYSSIVRGWLDVDMFVDIGTVGDTDALATGVKVTAVNDSATAPTFTISGPAIATTAGTHFVYIANPNSATAANPELNGLRQIVNSTGALGGLNPATAGQNRWKAAQRDTSTTALSLDLVMGMAQNVMQQSGEPFTDVWTGLKQQAKYYKLLQGLVRFSGDTGLSAGAVDKTNYNGVKVQAFPAFLDTDWFCLTLKDLVKVTGGITGPKWMSDLQGATRGQLWSPGTTQFVDALIYPIQVGATRRNTHAAATALQ